MCAYTNIFYYFYTVSINYYTYLIIIFHGRKYMLHNCTRSFVACTFFCGKSWYQVLCHFVTWTVVLVVSTCWFVDIITMLDLFNAEFFCHNNHWSLLFIFIWQILFEAGSFLVNFFCWYLFCLSPKCVNTFF